MARTTPRESVCLLERGRERWPGEYSKSLWAAIPEMRFTGHIKIPFNRIAFNISMMTEVNPLVTRANVEKLGGVPVFLFAGADNLVSQADATLRTQELLQSMFGLKAARRTIFRGLGHLDGWMSDVVARPGSVFETAKREIDQMLPGWQK